MKLTKTCFKCSKEFDPAKDFYITVHDRKTASRNFCSIGCANEYLED